MKCNYSTYVIFLILTLVTYKFSLAQNPGFEANANTNITNWTENNTYGDWISATDANKRSGNNAVKVNPTSTSSYTDIYCTDYTVTIPSSGTYYVHVIAWAKATVSNKCHFRLGVYDGITRTTDGAVSVLNTSYTRYTYDLLATNNTTYHPLLYTKEFSADANALTWVDDVHIYYDENSTTDVDKPSSPSNVVVYRNSSRNTAYLSWTNGTDSKSGIRGVLIFRREGKSTTLPNVTDQTYYSTNSSIGPTSAFGGTEKWTLLTYIPGSGTTTYTDNTISIDKTYAYAIVMVDNALNYSTPAYAITGVYYYINDVYTPNDDIYCTAAGNNGNSGLYPNLPKANFAGANGIVNTYNLNPGDTVFIDHGNYNTTRSTDDWLQLTSSDEGSALAYLCIIGAGQGKTVFERTTSTNPRCYYNTGADYVYVTKMTLKTSGGADYPIFLQGNCDNNKFEYCTIDVNTSSAKYAIYLEDDADKNEFNYCNITSTCSSETYSTIYMRCNTANAHPDSNIIYKCYIYGSGKIIEIYANSTTSTWFPVGNIISNNILENESTGQETGMIVLNRTINTSIYKNIFKQGNSGNMIRLVGNNTGFYIYNNYLANKNRTPDYPPCAIHIEAASQSGNIYHNSIYLAKGWCIHGTSNGAYSSINLKNNIFVAYDIHNIETENNAIYKGTGNFASCDYNLYYVNSASDVCCVNTTCYSTLANWKNVDHSDEPGKNGDENSIEGDPRYENPSNYDLDLLSNSPAFGAGTNLGITDDIKSNLRPNPPAIGAFDINSPLPIKILSTNILCDNNKKIISWTVANSRNIKEFIIERSDDLEKWDKIGVIPTKEENKIYYFIDSSTLNYYYKLIQRNISDELEEIAVLTSNCALNDNNKIELIVNPYENEFNLIIRNEDNNYAIVEIEDLCGKTVFYKKYSLEQGINFYSVKNDIIKTKGTYFIKVILYDKMIYRIFKVIF